VAVAKVGEGLAEGTEAGTLLRDGLIAGMGQVGQLYEEGEIFVPEMLVAARAMAAALKVLKPYLVEQGVKSNGKVAIGTTQGDLHDIGKNLVAMMLEGSGYEIVDLGVDVPADKFVQAVREGANVVAMSALLTTTMTNMQATIEALRDAGLRDQVRIIVAGRHNQDLRRRNRGGRLRRRRLECRTVGQRSAGRLNGKVHRPGHNQSGRVRVRALPAPAEGGPGAGTGDGTVYPELNFTLPPMHIDAGTMVDVRRSTPG